MRAQQKAQQDPSGMGQHRRIVCRVAMGVSLAPNVPSGPAAAAAARAQWKVRFRGTAGVVPYDCHGRKAAVSGASFSVYLQPS
jgi:hypothetical protein